MNITAISGDQLSATHTDNGVTSVRNDLDDSWFTPQEIDAKQERHKAVQQNQVHCHNGAPPAPPLIAGDNLNIIIIGN